MKVFLSHAHSDRVLARKVADVLQESGLEVWNEEREVLPGDNWAEKVNKALRESEAMVVLLTPDAVRSSHVRREIEFALGERKYNQKLIPVVVGSAADFDEDKIPWILSRLDPISLPKQGVRKERIRRIAKALSEAA